MYATTAVRVLIATYWKKNKLPTRAEPLLKLTEYADLPSLLERIRDKPKQDFILEWDNFKNYLKSSCNLSMVTAFELFL